MPAEPRTLAPVLDSRDDELLRFERDGFLGPCPRFADTGTLDRLGEKLTAMIDRRSRHPLYGRFSVRDWHLVDPDARALFEHPEVIARLRRLLSEDLVLWRSKVFLKSPGEGELGWHQEWGAFNGEEIGNDLPSLQPAEGLGDHFWDLTIWFALSDVDVSMGPIRFMPGTHTKRFPIEMVPMHQSAFWHDPTLGIDDVATLVERAEASSLVLDIDTSQVFRDCDPSALDLDEARRRILSSIAEMKAAVTLGVDSCELPVVELPMRRGEYVIFTERTMHGSGGNASPRPRLAINGRITRADTLIYPQRLRGSYVDGSNIDISNHRCVLLSGRDRCGNNAY